jgi:hypothetical protein
MHKVVSYLEILRTRRPIDLPAPPGQPKKPGQNEAKFLTYAEFAVNCAWRLAEFQSPKFKAVAIRVEDPVMAAPAGPKPPAEERTFCSSRLIQWRPAVSICSSCQRSTRRHDRSDIGHRRLRSTRVFLASCSTRELYARRARNTEAERKACEIRLRAERKAGELRRPFLRTQNDEISLGFQKNRMSNGRRSQLCHRSSSKLRLLTGRRCRRRTASS